MKTKFVDTPGQSQAEVDRLFEEEITKRSDKLAEEEEAQRVITLANIAEGRSKKPKLAAEVQRQRRANPRDKSTGLRF